MARNAEDVRFGREQSVSQINEVCGRLLEYSLKRHRGALNDAGLDARIHTALEQLAELVDFSAIVNEKGSLNVLVGGEIPLVVGEHRYTIGAAFYPPLIRLR